MADFSALKTAIQANIRTNANEEITGAILQDILLSMVTTMGDGAINDLVLALNNEITNRQNAVGAEAIARGDADTALGGRIDGVVSSINTINTMLAEGYVYAGIATPSTNPSTPTGKVFYLALTAGTYTHFGNIAVTQGINILKYNGSAWSLDAFVGIDDTPTPTSNKLVKSGGVFNDIMTNGSAFDLSAYNNGATYADLSAALTALNALPAAYKKGGMSLKFVMSSDNKCVQYRLMSDSFNTNVANWINLNPTQEIQHDANSVPSNAAVYAKFTEVYNDLYNVDSQLVFKNQVVVKRYSNQPIKSDLGVGNCTFIINGSGTNFFNVTASERGTNNQIHLFDMDEAMSLPVAFENPYPYKDLVNVKLYGYSTASEQLLDVTIIKKVPNVKNKFEASLDGRGMTRTFTKIQLIPNHYYKLVLLDNWNFTSESNIVKFSIDDGNDVSIKNWNGLVINILKDSNVLAYLKEFVFKANDTTNYEIGGRADVGEQIKFSIEDITGIVFAGNEVSTDITNLMKSGVIINNADIGNVPTLEEEDDNNWRCLRLSVKGGEIYEIKGSSGVNAILFAILDSQNRVIAKYNQNSYPYIFIPENGVVMVINTMIQNGDYYFRKLNCINSIGHNILSSLREGLTLPITDFQIGSVNNYAEIGSVASLQVDNDINWRYIILDVKEGEVYHITGMGGDSVRLYALLSITNRVIEVEAAYTSVNNKEIVIPRGCYKMAVNFNISEPYSLTGLSKDILNMVQEKKAISPYFKDVNIGVVPTDDYVGKFNDYNWGGQNTLTTDVYDKYDTLFNINSDISNREQTVTDGYITRTKIGNASDNQPLLMYDFKPTLTLDNSKLVKIFIVCGQHGFEKNSTYGLWYLLNDMVHNTDKSAVAKYLREFVEIIVVPVANPYGWDNNSYYNANNVNINRNWLVYGWHKETSPATAVNGDSPFDQPETAAIRDAVIGIDNILLFIDAHQKGNGLALTSNDLNWVDLTYPNSGKDKDAYYEKIVASSIFNNASITRLFKNLYGNEFVLDNNGTCGYVIYHNQYNVGYADLWALQQRNIMALTHEGFGGFQNGVLYDSNSHKANSELFGNYLKNFLSYYSK